MHLDKQPAGARPEGSGGPAISIILAANSFGASFPAGLEPFLQQTAGAETFELVLVDWEGGNSCGALADRVRSQPSAPRITYLRCPQRGRAAMNNLGATHATAPLIGFCGEDFVPLPAFVAAHLAYHAAHPERTRVAVGPAFSPPSLRAASPFLTWLEDSGELFGVRFRDLSPTLPPAYFYMGNVSLKRSFYAECGPFDERLPFPAYDDLEYGWRLAQLGMVSELVPEAACIHEHELTLAERRIHLGWAGASAAILASMPSGGAKPRRGLSRRLVAKSAHWCESALRDGPQIAGWRLSLWSAFLASYCRQRLTELRPGRSSRPSRAPDRATRS